MQISLLTTTAAAQPADPVQKIGGGGAFTTTAPPRGQSPAAEFAQAGGQEDVGEAVQSINDSLTPFGVSLQFSRDEESQAVVVKVVDQASGETLRQIPDEALLHLSAALGKLQGRLVNRRA